MDNIYSMLCAPLDPQDLFVLAPPFVSTNLLVPAHQAGARLTEDGQTVLEGTRQKTPIKLLLIFLVRSQFATANSSSKAQLTINQNFRLQWRRPSIHTSPQRVTMTS